MNQLLKFMIENLAFLYDDYGARFVDSNVQGPCAAISLESGYLRLNLLRDRSQIFVDVQGTSCGAAKEWFSFDVIKQLLTGKIEDSAVMDDGKCRFLKMHFVEITSAFEPDKVAETEKKLREFELARAKRLFG